MYAVRLSTSVEFTRVSRHCHARSILVREAENYTSIIDRMYDSDKRFEYITMAGGMVINREIKRISESHDAVRKKSYKDDAYSAFSFFMALFCQIFSSAQNTFSNQFIDCEEVNNCGKNFFFFKVSMTCLETGV